MGIKTRLTAAAVVAAAVALGTPLLQEHEGLRTAAYLDPVGIPTVCYGSTKGVKLGDRYSRAACEDMLRTDFTQHTAEVRASVPATVYMTPSELAAWGSFAYNVGTPTFRKSTAFKLLAAGKHVEACNQLPRWVYAGKRKLPGLVKRREVERQLCLRDYTKE